MRRNILAILLAVLLLAVAGGCGDTIVSNEGNQQENEEQTPVDDSQENTVKVDTKAPIIEGLTYESTMELEYAECFQVYRYEGGYSVIRVNDGRDYIVVPEGAVVPEDLPSSVIVLQQPLDTIYLQATSSGCFFESVDAIDHIRLSGSKEEAWYIEGIAEAMVRGDILFAGKYSEPDYEMFVAEKCDIAYESTMLLHNPEVMEKIEEMGIPVFIDRSTYEKHPLAKTEWVKLVGELVGEPEKAVEAFKEQVAYVEGLEDFKNTEKTVAFFYMNQNGIIVARKSSDYLPTMIELAGGRYIYKELGDPEKATSGVNLTMEEFYATAKDADYIIYNASIDEPLESVADLLAKSELFADFKAVKEGNVWTTGKSLHQATNDLGEMVLNINEMLTNEDAEELTFMKRLH